MKQQMKHRMSEEARKVADSLRQKGTSHLGVFVEESDRAKVRLTRNDVLAFLDSSPYSGPSYTPDNIAQFMASLGMSHHPGTVLDPVCGVGNLLSYCSDARILVGVDINNSLTPAVSIVCPRADLRHADFLHTDRDRSFDLVVADLPFGARDPATKVPLEQRILSKSLECLNPDGLLVALIPPSVLWSASASTFRETVLREYCLEAVIALWPGALQTTSIVPAVIVISKRKRDQRVMLAAANGAEDLQAIAAQFVSGKPEVAVETSRLVQEWNPSRVLAASSEERDGLRYARIRDLAEVRAGVSLPKSLLLDKGSFLVFKPRHVRGGRLAPQPGQAEYIGAESRHSKEESIVRAGDIIVSLRYTPGKVYLVRVDDPPCIVPSGFAIIRSGESGGYIQAFLADTRNQDLLVNKARSYARGTVILGLSVRDLGEIQIPVLPLDDLRDFDADELAKKTPEECAAFVDTWIALDQDYMRKADRSTNSDRNDARSTTCMRSQVHEGPAVASYGLLASTDRGSSIALELNMESMFQNYIQPVLERSASEFGRLVTQTLNAYYADDRRALTRIQGQLRHISSNTTQILADTAEIKSCLANLQSEFALVKRSDRQLEEKIVLLDCQLDRETSEIRAHSDTLVGYSELCALELRHWDRLEQLSQSSMTMAEYLLSTFEPLAEPDYSPCVLEYCKSLENELLTKVFMGFVQELRKPSVSKLMLPFVAADADGSGFMVQFAKALRPCMENSKCRFRFALGQMRYHLEDVGDEEKVASSTLLRAFHDYLGDHNFLDRILDFKHLKDLGRIVESFRNPCAHPAKLDRDTALRCKERVPPQIDWVVDAVRDPSLGGE